MLRRQKCNELEGLRECCEVCISVQPELERTTVARVPVLELWQIRARFTGGERRWRLCSMRDNEAAN